MRALLTALWRWLTFSERMNVPRENCPHLRLRIDDGAPGGFNPYLECADCGQPMGPLFSGD